LGRRRNIEKLSAISYDFFVSSGHSQVHGEEGRDLQIRGDNSGGGCARHRKNITVPAMKFAHLSGTGAKPERKKLPVLNARVRPSVVGHAAFTYNRHARVGVKVLYNRPAWNAMGRQVK